MALHRCQNDCTNSQAVPKAAPTIAIQYSMLKKSLSMLILLTVAGRAHVRGAFDMMFSGFLVCQWALLPVTGKRRVVLMPALV